MKNKFFNLLLLIVISVSSCTPYVSENDEHGLRDESSELIDFDESQINTEHKGSVPLYQ